MNWIISAVCGVFPYLFWGIVNFFDMTLYGFLCAIAVGPSGCFLLNIRGYFRSDSEVAMSGILGGMSMVLGAELYSELAPYNMFNEASLILHNIGIHTLGFIFGIIWIYVGGVKDEESRESWPRIAGMFEFSPKFKMGFIIILTLIAVMIGNKIQNNPERMVNKIRHIIGGAALESAAGFGSPMNEEDIKPIIILCQKIIDKYPETKYAAQSYELMAIPFRWIKQYDKSFELLERAKEIYERLEDKKGIEHINSEISSYKSWKKIHEREKEYYERQQKK